MSNKQHRDPLSDFRAPGVPGHLKRSVLDAAGETLAAESETGVWDRLWDSRPLRAAWAVTTLGLLVAHVTLSVTPDRGRSAASVASQEEQREAEELRELLALPTIEISPRAERMAMGTNDKEVKS